MANGDDQAQGLVAVPVEPLLKEAEERFTNLSLAEQRVVMELLSPADAVLPPPPGEGYVRAALIPWLCTSQDCIPHFPRRVLVFRLAAIDGQVNLSFCHLPRPVTFLGCNIPGGMLLHHARTPHLKIDGGECGAVRANGLQCSGDVVFDGRARISGAVQLRNASVHGSLEIRDGVTIEAPGEVVLEADSARVRGTVRLGDGTSLVGQVRLDGARIGGDWVLQRAHISEPNRDYALMASLVVVGGSVLGQGMRLEGGASFVGARIAGSVEFDDAVLNAGERAALNLDGTNISVDVRLNGKLVAPGGVRIIGAVVGGDVECGGRFTARGKDPALNLGRSRVTGNLYLDTGLETEGTVSLVGTHVSGRLKCGHAVLRSGADLKALDAERMVIRGSVEIGGPERDVRVGGSLSFQKCSIGSDLSIQGIAFECDRPCGIDAQGATVRGTVTLADLAEFHDVMDLRNADFRYLRIHRVGFAQRVGTRVDAENLTVHANAEFVGLTGIPQMIRLDGVAVGRDLLLQGLQFSAMVDNGLSLDSATVSGDLRWRANESNQYTRIVFTDTHVGRLRLDHSGWPAGRLFLKGFTYNGLELNPPEGTVPHPSDQLDPLKWLGMQQPKPFQPQPYEQMIRILRDTGHEDEAMKVAKAKFKARRCNGALAPLSKLRSLFLEYTIGHGYDVRPVLILSALLVALGTVLFLDGQQRGAVMPYNDVAFGGTPSVVGRDAALPWYATKAPPEQLPPGYPSFNAFLYSLDAFLPVVDLHQESHWHPVRGACAEPFGQGLWPRCGMVLSWYLFALIGIGWAATTLLVINFTGLIRRI